MICSFLWDRFSCVLRSLTLTSRPSFRQLDAKLTTDRTAFVPLNIQPPPGLCSAPKYQPNILYPSFCHLVIADKLRYVSGFYMVRSKRCRIEKDNALSPGPVWRYTKSGGAAKTEEGHPPPVGSFILDGKSESGALYFRTISNIFVLLRLVKSSNVINIFVHRQFTEAPHWHGHMKICKPPQIARYAARRRTGREGRGDIDRHLQWISLRLAPLGCHGKYMGHRRSLLLQNGPVTSDEEAADCHLVFRQFIILPCMS